MGSAWLWATRASAGAGAAWAWGRVAWDLALALGTAALACMLFVTGSPTLEGIFSHVLPLSYAVAVTAMAAVRWLCGGMASVVLGCCAAVRRIAVVAAGWAFARSGAATAGTDPLPPDLHLVLCLVLRSDLLPGPDVAALRRCSRAVLGLVMEHAPRLSVHLGTDTLHARAAERIGAPLANLNLFHGRTLGHGGAPFHLPHLLPRPSRPGLLPRPFHRVGRICLSSMRLSTLGLLRTLCTLPTLRDLELQGCVLLDDASAPAPALQQLPPAASHPTAPAPLLHLTRLTVFSCDEGWVGAAATAAGVGHSRGLTAALQLVDPAILTNLSTDDEEVYGLLRQQGRLPALDRLAVTGGTTRDAQFECLLAAPPTLRAVELQRLALRRDFWASGPVDWHLLLITHGCTVLSLALLPRERIMICLVRLELHHDGFTLSLDGPSYLNRVARFDNAGHIASGNDEEARRATALLLSPNVRGAGLGPWSFLSQEEKQADLGLEVDEKSFQVRGLDGWGHAAALTLLLGLTSPLRQVRLSRGTLVLCGADVADTLVRVTLQLLPSTLTSLCLHRCTNVPASPDELFESVLPPHVARLVVMSQLPGGAAGWLGQKLRRRVYIRPPLQRQEQQQQPLRLPPAAEQQQASPVPPADAAEGSEQGRVEEEAAAGIAAGEGAAAAEAQEQGAGVAEEGGSQRCHTA